MNFDRIISICFTIYNDSYECIIIRRNSNESFEVLNNLLIRINSKNLYYLLEFFAIRMNSGKS